MKLIKILTENNRLIKLKRKSSNFSGIYKFNSSSGDQLIYVKHEDDVKAIDLLLQNNLERQALVLCENRSNKFQDVPK